MSLSTPYYEEPGITIYLGDCREILPQLEPVDMIFTDPPYGHNNNDGDLIANIERAIPSKRKAGEDRSMVCESRPIANDGPEANELVVWDKGPIGMGWHYRRSYECVLVAQRDLGRCNWYDETDRIENIIRHIPKIIPTKADHPTPKPVELAMHFIQLHTQSGDVVLDPFMGGGSTAEAAKKMGRQFVGVELDERWAKIAVNRLRQEVLAL